MAILILMLIFALSLASPVVAERAVTVQPLDNDEISTCIESDRQDCLVGNSNPLYFAISDWVLGGERYTYIYDPLETCACPAGFQVEFVHMLVKFGAEDVPTTFDAYVSVDGQAWNDELGCWYPGDSLCTSDVTSITISAAGIYDIGLPTPACACMSVGYQYSLSYVFVGALTSYPDIVTDAQPSSCTSWNDYGYGWYDLVDDFGFPGNILMWADADCCETPVADAAETWGGLKNLYR